MTARSCVPDTVVEESNLFLYLSLLENSGNAQRREPVRRNPSTPRVQVNGDVHLIEEGIEDKQYAGVVENHGQSRTTYKAIGRLML